MSLKQDWIMKQIDQWIEILRRFLFQKDKQNGDLEWITSVAMRIEYENILSLFLQRKLNEAENMLFDLLDGQDIGYLRIALEFYRLVNHLDDQELKQSDFSREEIKEGMMEAIHLYGLSDFYYSI